jgi:adenine-specific DNA-methyltransferase
MRRKPRPEEVRQYTHDEQKRLNNPPVGLVTAETDHLNGKKAYKFDPHIDPLLDWAGKTEGTSFNVDMVSLHVHERIDPLTIIDAVRNRELREQQALFHYFESKENNPPIRDAIQFYKHSQGWSNRLIAGDSLLVMNSLLEKEGMAGKVQMVYLDPPYGIKYGSNFQPFTNKREVTDGKDDDLAQEPETVRAFRDTWELGIHSYLAFLRSRLLLARNLLSETGSCFVQISDANLHHVREIMDEVFGAKNFVNLIMFQKTGYLGSEFLDSTYDFIIWYGKDKDKTKFRTLFVERTEDALTRYNYLEDESGSSLKLTQDQLEGTDPIPKGRRWRDKSLLSSGETKGESSLPFEFEGRTFKPNPGTHWNTGIKGLEKLASIGRIVRFKDRLNFKIYLEDFPLIPIGVIWQGMMIGTKLDYVVQTSTKVIERCVLMTTDPGDLVLDPTCGSGTTAYVCEQWGRRWITCDTSRVSITIAKQRLMTALYDYYELLQPKEGVGGGFRYKTIPHVTLKALAKGDQTEAENIYDQPLIDGTLRRVTGPFTVEAVPSQRVRNLEEIQNAAMPADASIARSGETYRQNDWINELLSTGIRGKNGQTLEFARIDSLPGMRWIHAEAETKDGKKAVISFGPEYAPLEQRQVELAIDEALEMVPKPNLVLFASFQFDPEAAKDLDELKWPGVDVLKVQMNTDLLTSDLKKHRSSNESFWLIGQPDLEVKKVEAKYQIIVNGFDYYNTKTGSIESGDSSKIAIWELDTDYDGRSLYPRQVFFPIAGQGEGWATLAKNLKAEIDEELIQSYRGSKSLPFTLGGNKQVAVKIIDDRGIESLRVVKIRE